MLHSTITKATYPTGEAVYMIRVCSPNGRNHALYLYPEKSIFVVSTKTNKLIKEYEGEPEDTIAILETARIHKEVRRCYRSILARSDWL